MIQQAGGMARFQKHGACSAPCSARRTRCFVFWQAGMESLAGQSQFLWRSSSGAPWQRLHVTSKSFLPSHWSLILTRGHAAPETTVATAPLNS